MIYDICHTVIRGVPGMEHPNSWLVYKRKPC